MVDCQFSILLYCLCHLTRVKTTSPVPGVPVSQPRAGGSPGVGQVRGPRVPRGGAGGENAGNVEILLLCFYFCGFVDDKVGLDTGSVILGQHWAGTGS